MVPAEVTAGQTRGPPSESLLPNRLHSIEAYSCILFAVYPTDVIRVYRLQGLLFPPIKNCEINTHL